MNWDRIVGLVGLVLGIVGLVLTIYGIRKARERKEPRLYCSHFEKVAIARDPVPDVEITYKGQRVDRVTTTLLWFWNAADKPILRSDVPPTQPIVVHLKDDPDKSLILLDAQVTRISRPSVNFQARPAGDADLMLEFDFLDKGDGALVEVQHSGSVLVSVSVTGVILGAADGIRLMEPFSRVFALYPGGTLMLRLMHPNKDRLWRAAVGLGWLSLASYSALSLWGDRATTTTGIRVGSVAAAIFSVLMVWRAYVAMTRPMYAIPGNLRPRPPRPRLDPNSGEEPDAATENTPPLAKSGDVPSK